MGFKYNYGVCSFVDQTRKFLKFYTFSNGCARDVCTFHLSLAMALLPN